VIAGSIDTFDAGRLPRILDESATVSPVEIRGTSRKFQRVEPILALSRVAPVVFTEVAA
jgi:hypothetical protein